MATSTSEYIHKVDKSKIPTCNILGVDIAAIDMEWLLDYLINNIHDLSGDYICVSNVHTTVTAYEDDEYGLLKMIPVTLKRSWQSAVCIVNGSVIYLQSLLLC